MTKKRWQKKIKKIIQRPAQEIAGRQIWSPPRAAHALATPLFRHVGFVKVKLKSTTYSNRS